MKFTHAPKVVADTPEGAVLVSLRRALVHSHCRCTAEIGRVVSTPRGFWWTPSHESSDGPPVAVELDETDADGRFVEGWCPTHGACDVPVRELLVQARRAQKTGQRRHTWLDAS